VIFDEVSKFYGEVLGVNRVTLNIPPGITSLVGPNGSGKTTLMNLMTGLIHPDNGQILMRGISPRDPEALMRITGYATQYDTAPRWATGFTFITTGLLLFGYGRVEAEEKAWKALEHLSLTEAANRKVAAYSKGMRQRVRLAQAIAHDPELLVLDEPLNGLDPLVRAETIALFRTWASEGKHVILSSHVLQEVDLISDQVVLIANGMIIAEGTIRAPVPRPLPRRVGRGLAALQRGSHHGNQAERRPYGAAGHDPRPGAVRACARADRARRPSDRRRRVGRRERGRPVRVLDWRRIECARVPSTSLGRGRHGRSPESSFAVPSLRSEDCGSTRSRSCPRSSSSVTAWTRSGGSSGCRGAG
jgi:ABC-type multidrug transport system ATPase subunit